MRFLFVLLASVLMAQDPASLRDAQEVAATKQREAARVQAGGVSGGHAFFTIPFASELPLPSAPDCSVADRDKVDAILTRASQKESIGVDVLRAVVQVESGFNSCAVSPKGAQGLMQLMPEVQQELGVKDPFDADQNIAAGASLLKRLLAEFKGDLKLALAAYNSGSSRVNEAKGVPDIPETKDYVEKILGRLQKPAGKPPPQDGAGK